MNRACSDAMSATSRQSRATLFHLLVAETLVGAPLTDPSGFIADLDAFALFLAQMIDLGDCFGK